MSAFDALHHDDQPVQPDRRFAARLETQVTEALVATVDLPERNRTMTDTADRTLAATGGLHPYIAVADAAAAIDWYTEVLGARDEILMNIRALIEAGEYRPQRGGDEFVQ